MRIKAGWPECLHPVQAGGGGAKVFSNPLEGFLSINLRALELAI